MKKVYDIIEEYLSDQKTIVIGCSGGPDSMCLLHLLIEYRYNHNIQIICAHVNHNVRDVASQEQDFVKKYCHNNNIIFETTTLNEKDNSEANLRAKRYQFLFEILTKYNAKYLLTAHHGDDLIETILMRLTRGSNISGYGGFKLLSNIENFYIFRPLIYLTKNQILEYVNKYDIPFVLDKSNEELKYTRNRYRHQVLPFLKKENPNVHLKFLEFSQEIYACDEIIKNIVEKEFIKNFSQNTYYLTDFKTYHPLVQNKIIEKYLHIIYQEKLNFITKKHLNLIIDMIHKNTNSQIDLPNNITLIKQYNQIKVLDKNQTTFEYKLELKDKIVLPNKYMLEITNSCPLTNNYCTRLSSQEIKLPLYVRNRKPSDKMQVKNMNGSKKLQDIYVDSKIPFNERNLQPVVVDANDTIIWLPGLKKSKFDKSNKEKYDIIVKYYFDSTNKGENIWRKTTP